MSPTSSGPQAESDPIRVERAYNILSCLEEHYPDRIEAAAVYGSTGRSEGGPYSDLEMFCVLSGENFDHSLEWSAGPWKAEVNLLSRDVARSQAAALDGNWAITQGQFAYNRVLVDRCNHIPALHRLVLNHAEEEFNRAIREGMIEDIYEIIGKLRNLESGSRPGCLSLLVSNLALHACGLVGIANRHIFTSAGLAFTEALTLPNRPDGFDTWIGLIITGRLDQDEILYPAAEALWSGMEAWVLAKGIDLYVTPGEIR